MEYSDKKRYVEIEAGKIKVSVKLSGLRWFLLSGAAVFSSVVLLAIGDELLQLRKLKTEEIEIKKEQLELSRRQFQMDSLKWAQKNAVPQK